MKKILLLILCAVSAGLSAQKYDQKYMAGAVPVRDDMVTFAQTYEVPGKSKAEIFTALADYVQKVLVESENSLPQARITVSDASEGLLVASLEETLYFKRKAFSTDGTRFFYQLICRVGEGRFDIEMRRIHYIYDITDTPSNETVPDLSYRAEKWITDEAALSKDGTKMYRIPGKFRRFTIDRKDQIFQEAAKAAGARIKVKKYVEVEE